MAVKRSVGWQDGQRRHTGTQGPSCCQSTFRTVKARPRLPHPSLVDQSLLPLGRSRARFVSALLLTTTPTTECKFSSRTSRWTLHAPKRPAQAKARHMSIHPRHPSVPCSQIVPLWLLMQ